MKLGLSDLPNFEVNRVEVLRLQTLPHSLHVRFLMFLGLSAGGEKPIGSGIFGCSQVVLPLRTWLLCSEKVLLSGPVGVVWVFF